MGPARCSSSIATHMQERWQSKPGLGGETAISTMLSMWLLLFSSEFPCSQQTPGSPGPHVWPVRSRWSSPGEHSANVGQGSRGDRVCCPGVLEGEVGAVHEGGPRSLVLDSLRIKSVRI